MTDELEIMWNKMVVAYFKVLSRHFSGGTEGNHENVRIAALWAETWTRNLQNAKQQC
jgi:hypothetical protein